MTKNKIIKKLNKELATLEKLNFEMKTINKKLRTQDKEFVKLQNKHYKAYKKLMEEL